MKKTILLLSQFGTITPFAEKYLLEHLREHHFAKDEIILHAGSIAKRIYFIDYGLIRHFIETPKSESTIWLLIENAIVVAFRSFFENKPSLENIQALQPTVTYSLTKDELEYLIKHDRDFFEINEKIQKFYRALENEYNYILKQPEEQRYDWLLQKHRHLLGMGVSNAILASFLDMGETKYYDVRRNLTSKNTRK